MDYLSIHPVKDIWLLPIKDTDWDNTHLENYK